MRADKTDQKYYYREEMSAITPLVSFAFQRDRCLGNMFYGGGSQASTVGIMNRIQPQTECLNGDGVSSTSKVTSSLNVGTLKSLLGTKDFSVEMWLRPKLNITTTATIFAIGRDSVAVPDCKNNILVSCLLCPLCLKDLT